MTKKKRRNKFVYACESRETKANHFIEMWMNQKKMHCEAQEQLMQLTAFFWKHTPWF